MFKNALQLFEDLEKMDPALARALANIRAGRATPADANAVARGIYTDTMVPRMGNKLAYQDHVARNGNQGYHVHVDMNDFGQINKQHGEKMGDAAIKQFGGLSNEVSRLFGGKSFRNGGDEFKFWFHKPEQAHGFARELRARLEKQPKVGGTHNLAASVGIGFNPDHAESALLEAKKQLGSTDMTTGKRINMHSVGNAPTVIHSKTHEPAPAGWKKPGAPAEMPKTTQSLAPEGLKFHNPLQKDEGSIHQPIPTTTHPAVHGGRFGIVTAENPFHPVATPGGNDALEKELKARGLKYEKVQGKYSNDNPENGFMIHNVDPKLLMDIGHRYGQDSVIHSHHGQHKLIYTNGPNAGKYNPGAGHVVHEREPEMYYSTIKHGGKPVHFTLNLDFDRLEPMAAASQPPAHAAV